MNEAFEQSAALQKPLDLQQVVAPFLIKVEQLRELAVIREI